MEQILIVITFLFALVSYGDTGDNLKSHPGHLKPFGDLSAGTRIPVAESLLYPTPTSFIENYVLPSRPLLLKGVFKSSPAYSLWDDEYFRTIHEPSESFVNVEMKKKEDRNQEIIKKSFKSFIAIYRNQPVYMVSSVPSHLERDVPVAASLQCPALISLFRQNVMWMSSGGTKSVVHLDEYENLNCLVRGGKELILVDRKKHPKGVPLDKAGETFSSLDVDAVDYHKYPSMADVGEYYYANVTAGDCLYIPYKWIHQVRSHDRNIAVNLWWDHASTKTLNLDRCKDSLNDKQITFRDIDWGDFVDDESFKPQIVSMAEDSDVTFEKLRSVYFEHNFSGQSIFHGLPSSYPRHGEDQLLSLFSKLDSNSDGLVALTELDSLSKTQWEEVERLEESLSVWIDGILSKDESSKEEL